MSPVDALMARILASIGALGLAMLGLDWVTRRLRENGTPLLARAVNGAVLALAGLGGIWVANRGWEWPWVVIPRAMASLVVLVGLAVASTAATRHWVGMWELPS